jgi:hypothetical protein
MRNAVQMFASSLLAVLVAMFVYWLVVYRPQQQALLAEQVQTQEKLQTLASEQSQIRKTLTQAQAEAALDPALMLIRDDFVASASMRVAIAEFYMSTQKMPATNAEAGLPAPDDYRGKTLKFASVGADGTIEFVFDVNSGVDGGRIRLIPDLSHANAMGISWRCATADYALIKRALPTCEYEPPAGEPAVHVAPKEG